MKPTRLTGLLTRSAFVLALAFAKPALAADPPSTATPGPTPGQIQAARELFAAAAKDELANRWTEALEKLRRVAEVKLTAGVRYHIGFCEEKLGQLASALAHYTEARDAAEREHNKDVLNLVKEPILLALRARVPTLTIVVHPATADAVVTIDDHRHPAGLWRVAVPIDPGVHRIEARAPERDAFSREITVNEGDEAVLEVILPVSPPPPPPAAPRPVATSSPTSTAHPQNP